MWGVGLSLPTQTSRDLSQKEFMECSSEGSGGVYVRDCVDKLAVCLMVPIPATCLSLLCCVSYGAVLLVLCFELKLLFLEHKILQRCQVGFQPWKGGKDAN